MLKGENLTRGWYGLHMNPVGEDGLTRSEREQKAMLEAGDREAEETLRKAMEDESLMTLDLDHLSKYLNSAPTANGSSTSRTVKRDAPSTLSSRRAASALSGSAASAARPTVPRFAAPTTATTSRVRTTTPAPTPVAQPASRKPASATAPTAASMRHAATASTSKSTLGYSKGRAVSASTKQPLTSGQSRPGTAGSATTVRSVSTHAGVPDKQTKMFLEQKKLLEDLITEDPELEMLVAEKNGEGNDAEAEDDLGMGILAPGRGEWDVDDDLGDFELEVPGLEGEEGKKEEEDDKEA